MLLFDRESEGFRAWKQISRYTNQYKRVKWTIDLLKEWANRIPEADITLRLWSSILTYNATHLIYPDGEEKLAIEFYTYDFTVLNKPHIIVSKRDNAYWFHQFSQQIEIAWDSSEDNQYPLTILKF